VEKSDQADFVWWQVRSPRIEWTTNKEIYMAPFTWSKNAQTASFFERARKIHDGAGFEENEREYKLRLANAFGIARAALFRGDRGWHKKLREALHIPENNIIDWRHREAFLNAVEDRPALFRAALHRLWSPSPGVHKRVQAFCSYLTKVGFKQKGGQLTVTSTLLMAVDAANSPPVRTRKFSDVLKRGGFAPFSPSFSAADRYAYAIDFLDSLIREGTKHGLHVRDRLDAQAIVWCLDDKPKKSRASVRADSADAAEAKALKKIRADASLSPTQKEALIQARRGQGKFRDSLFAVWGSCAITGCTVSTLLRASHLKPWRLSSNKERLDPHNGLLLTPTLDCALDRGLIAIGPNGQVLISPHLPVAQRKVLGLQGAMHLRDVLPHHKPYFKYHRKRVFQA
jgi:hypothetical protein